MLHQVRQVVAVPVPVGCRIVAALGDDHRPAALGEEQEREARGHDGVLDAAPAEGAGEGVLGVDEHLRPLQVPVGLADEPPRGHPVQPVEIIVMPGRTAGARILHHGEPPAEPFEPAFQHPGRRAAAAAGDVVAGGLRGGGAHVLRRDPDAGDPGTGHAARPAAVADGVAPRPVAVGAGDPVSVGPLPDVWPHADTRPIGLVQRQEGELGIRVVAGALGGAVRPRSRRRPLRHLRALQPFHVAGQDRPVGVGGEHGEHERLQRNGVGFLRLLAAQPVERPLHGELVGVDPGVGQRQHHQRRRADPGIVGAHRAFPRTVGLLLSDQPVAGLLDRPLDLLGRRRRLLAAGRPG